MSGGYGVIETITGAMSIHSIKKGLTTKFVDDTGRTRTKYGTLKDHFLQKFGAETSAAYTTAQQNFIRSLAGYSMVTYILNLKDRHNGNILIDEAGHVIRIPSTTTSSNTCRHRLWFFPLQLSWSRNGIRTLSIQIDSRIPLVTKPPLRALCQPPQIRFSIDPSSCG